MNDNICAICLGEITIFGNVDKCTHSFCYDCIMEWGKLSNTCPLCKNRFFTIERKIDHEVSIFTVIQEKHLMDTQVLPSIQQEFNDEPEEPEVPEVYVNPSRFISRFVRIPYTNYYRNRPNLRPEANIVETIDLT